MTKSYRDRVAALFKQRQGEWIHGLDIAHVGGAYAWRTRVSDCRRELGMAIENRVRRLPSGVRASEYRYVTEA